jgi:hypothetical protein
MQARNRSGVTLVESLHWDKVEDGWVKRKD